MSNFRIQNFVAYETDVSMYGTEYDFDSVTNMINLLISYNLHLAFIINRLHIIVLQHLVKMVNQQLFQFYQIRLT